MEAKTLFFEPKKTLNLRGRLWPLERPVVMGILNATPDSFYPGSRTASIDAALRQAENMLADGADMLDIGGYSTRPGAAEVPEAEELARVVPVVGAVAKHFPQAVLSVDTFRATVAEAAVEAGARLVNDVSGGADALMFGTVARCGVPYILMHSRGTPQNMARLTDYDDLLQEVLAFFIHKLPETAQAGIKDVVVDMGFGFAKTIDQNYHLLKHLSYFQVLGLPLLVGISRKSMIHKRLHIPVEAALNGTTVLHTLALAQGARLLRVHDVKAAAEAVALYGFVTGSRGQDTPDPLETGFFH